MPAFTVVIITLNEEKNIDRCLRSVRDIADEIVVVDSFSTDKTEDICRSYGVRFIQHPFRDYISQHRYADSRAKNDLILSLDADEAVSEELKASVLKASENMLFDGYMMNRRTCYCGKWIRYSGWYPDRKLRLYNRQAGNWEGLQIHEKFVMKPGTKTGFLSGDILHHSFSSLTEHVRQAEKFTTLTALAAYERGKRSNLLCIVVNPCLKFLRDYILKRGFLDGYAGLQLCRVSAFATFMKYAKLRELQNQKHPVNHGS